MEQTQHRTFRRRDGVLGVGFVMMFAGVEQASIAWPDRQAERFIVDDMDRNGINEVGGKTHEDLGKEVMPDVDPSKPTSEDGPAVSPPLVLPNPFAEPISEAQAIRNYLAEHGTGATNKAIVEALKAQGVNVSSSQVTREKADFKVVD